MTVDAVLRKGILAAATDRRIAGFVRRHGMRLGAARFVAGETLEECLAVLARLNERGWCSNTTLLGEDVRDRAEAVAVADDYRRILDALAERGLRANVA